MSTMTKRRRWSLLVTVGAGLLLLTLDNSILYTAVPTLTEDLQASSTQSLWIINAYPRVMAGLLPEGPRSVSAMPGPGSSCRG